MNFKNSLPEFYEEVRALMIKMNRHDLAGQLKELVINYRCPCTNAGCASFKVEGGGISDAFEVAGQRRSTFTPLLDLNAEKGSIKIVTDQLGRINAFEVLKRPDVRRKLFRR